MKSRLHQLALACFGAVEIVLHGFGYCVVVTDFGRAHDPSPDSPCPSDNRRVLWLTRFWISPRLMAARSTSRSLLCSREPRGRRGANEPGPPAQEGGPNGDYWGGRKSQCS